MANIITNNILNQLTEENKLIYDLLDKYRNFSLNLQNICVCNQKNNEFMIKSLEYEYKNISIIRQKGFIKTKVTFEAINTQRVPPNDHKLCESDGNHCEKSTEDMDTDYGVSDGNDTQFSDLFDEDISESMNEKKDFDCDYIGCKQKFKTKASLHSNQTHTSNEGYKCEECHKSFLFYDGFKRHSTVHSLPASQRFGCEECHEMCPTKNNLVYHMKKVHSHKIEKIKCDYPGCGQMFKDAIRMQKHKDHAHTDDRITCEWPGCGQTYKYKKNYRDHMLTHTNELQIPCKVEGCPKVFMSNKQLRSHMVAHRKSFVCTWPGCEDRFRDSDCLEGHINRQHRNVKPFNCIFSGCEKAFYKKGDLECHRRYMHRKDKPTKVKIPEPIETIHKCAECPFETKFINQLRGHITIKHSNEELTVKCEFEDCPKMFGNRHRMKDHMSRVHTFERFQCDWPGCDYTTQRKETIRNHKLIHSGKRNFKCDFEGCAKSFITSKNLWQHRQTHEKKNVCSWPECGQRFSDESSLTAHMNKHLNLRPFKCVFNDCNKDFKIDRHLKHHIRTVHKIKPKDLI